MGKDKQNQDVAEEVLKAHIQQCEKHPVYQLTQQLAQERTRREAVEAENQCKDTLIEHLQSELRRSEEALRLVRAAIVWALGYTDFRPREEGEGSYWWRTELRLRAKLTGEQIDAILATLDAAPGATTTPTTNLPEISSKPGEGKA